MNILVCDDDKEIVEAIEIYLKNDGYCVLKAYDGVQALSALDQNDIHLIIMDIMMPHMDGMKATNEIRKTKNIPIMMLSATSEDMDKIMGLNMGADDYVAKPFNPLELLARVKSLLRRYVSLGSYTPSTELYRTGELVVDDDSKEVFVDGEGVKLTPLEYKILSFLTQNAGKVYSIEHI